MTASADTAAARRPHPAARRRTTGRRGTTIYDDVRYSTLPHAGTHPDRLATVATLHGLEPPDPFHGRVLEIGCGAGGNLMAMVAATPGLRALGVDLAAGPIAEGQAAAAAIGLRNLTLRQGDVRELTDGHLGEFDYVVAHGVYGWMPPDANDALLATVAASLAPGGIAYVSYNVQPGGYFRRMLRDAGLWHARGITAPLKRAEKAQELYRFLAQRRATSDDAYGALLERELPLVDGPLYSLVHDDLAEFWEPVWFAEFAAHAARHGLDYVGEADLFDFRSAALPEDIAEVWRLADGDRVAYETYTDLLTARHFRKSVLCRAGAEVSVSPAPDRTARLHWAARPNADPPKVGLLAAAFARLDRERHRTVAFDELRVGSSRGSERPGRGAAQRRPVRVSDPARRSAMGGDGTGAPPGGVTASTLAGRAGRGPHVAGLHDGAHRGASGAPADHAAGWHARPRRDPRRAARGRRR